MRFIIRRIGRRVADGIASIGLQASKFRWDFFGGGGLVGEGCCGESDSRGSSLEGVWRLLMVSEMACKMLSQSSS